MSDRVYGHATNVGCVRTHNEDCYAADPGASIWIVADGMGGQEAGEVASTIVVDSMLASIKAGFSLDEAFAHSHQAVVDAAEGGQGDSSMGSTAVVLQMKDNDYEIAWVGDSRAYLWNGALHQLTRDHTFAQQLLDAGVINEQEAVTHPHRNKLTRVLEASATSESSIERVSGTLATNEMILLCSDGLSSHVSGDQISSILDQDINIQEKVDRLVDAALAAGGKDNITVILVAAKKDLPHSEKQSVSFSQHRTLLWVGLLLAAAFCLAVFIGWLASSA